MSSRLTLVTSLLSATVASLLTGDARADDLQSEWQRPRGTYVLTDPNPAEQAGGEVSRIIYLNRCTGGCDITKVPRGENNARENTSDIPATNDGAVSTVDEFAGSEEHWNDLVACVKEVYAPYDVDVVTEDPGEVAYHEAIVAGDPANLKLADDVGGIADLSCGGALNNVISFTFANIYPTSALWELCGAVAQESAHAFGLDHEIECGDPMTYARGCGQKFFRNTAYHCGVTPQLPADCACGGTMQNSHQMLNAVFGEGTLPPPPTVTIQSPLEDAEVTDDFAVYSHAVDKRGVEKVELLLNGWVWGSLDGHEGVALDDTEAYIFAVPANVPDGVIDIQVRASNDLGVTGSSTTTVTKGEPCSNADTCLGGQLCEEGRCFWPEPVAELGDSCDRDQDCISADCATTSAGKLCTEECSQLITGSCSEGFDCDSTDHCVPAVDEGGCCSVSDGGGLAAGQVALFLAVVGGMLLRRPRRRR